MVKLSKEGFDLLKLAWGNDSESLQKRIDMGYEEVDKLHNKAREMTDNHRKLYGRDHSCSGFDQLKDEESAVPFQYDYLNDVWVVYNESDYAGNGDEPDRYVIFCCPYCGQRLRTDD